MATTLSAPTLQTKPGERVGITRLEGYVPNCPQDGCRHGCQCYEAVTYAGTLLRTHYFADNSIVAEVKCDDGKVRQAMLEAPKGDAC
jgi:hypothetical protein